MSIEQMMIGLAASLPENSKPFRSKTIREVSLSFLGEGKWHVMAGGHHAVALGEWRGDFYAHGSSAEEAINNCLKEIIEARR
jgi:hypothetical protein